MESTRYRKQFLLLGFVAIVYTVGTSLLFSGYTIREPILNYAIAADLLLIVPIVLYIAFRGTKLLAPSLSISFIASIYLLSTSSTVLPEWFLTALLYTSFAAEAALVSFVLFQIYRGYRTVTTDGSVDIVDRVKSATNSVIGKNLASSISASELLTMIFALRPPFKEAEGENLYHYRAGRGLVSLHIGIVFLTIQETFVVHFVVSLWSPLAAWILTIGSLYFVVLILANLRACYALPVSLQDEVLRIRYGHVFDAKIPVRLISSIEELSYDQRSVENAVKASIAPGFEQLNCVVRLQEETTVSSFMGFQKKTDEIAFYVDDPKKLIENLGRGS